MNFTTEQLEKYKKLTQVTYQELLRNRRNARKHYRDYQNKFIYENAMMNKNYMNPIEYESDLFKMRKNLIELEYRKEIAEDAVDAYRMKIEQAKISNSLR